MTLSARTKLLGLLLDDLYEMTDEEIQMALIKITEVRTNLNNKEAKEIVKKRIKKVYPKFWVF